MLGIQAPGGLPVSCLASGALQTALSSTWCPTICSHKVQVAPPSLQGLRRAVGRAALTAAGAHQCSGPEADLPS